MKQTQPNYLAPLVAQYLGMESMEITEELLELCGASIDARALSLLRERLHEEETQIPQLEAHGYIRMREKCTQLIASLRSLIAAFEHIEQGTGRDNV
ncbi:MAG: hypothetical protein ACXVCM_18585 [Ktedonobacteraceae bacterium]